MPLQLDNLNEARAGMVAEIERDIANGTLYISPRLSPKGVADYPDLLKQAATGHDDTWLAAQLASGGRMNTTETRNKPSGGTTVAKVPITAPETLAEGEFNRYYIRGLCVYATQQGTPDVVAYRAKAVQNPRPDSQAKIGRSYPVGPLLTDLRNHPGVDLALGLPAGPNSGLSVRLP